MIDLTLIILGNKENQETNRNIETIYCTGDNIINNIDKALGKYIVFIKEEDKIAKEYLTTVVETLKNDFDCCFINYNIEYNHKNNTKICTNKIELANNKPYYGEYIWAFIYNKEKLKKIIKIDDMETFNKTVDEEFINRTAINNLIYFHNPKGKKIIKNLGLCDLKRTEYYKNIIYIGSGCNGIFNGYISWINNLGRYFEKLYEITIIYDKIQPITFNSFSKYFNCVERQNNINYVCESLSITYSTYYYPKNLFTLDQNYLFIHGNMSDYPNARRFHDDIFSHYVAVSKTAAKKAIGYFPTDNIEFILNPFVLDNDLVKPHLTLTSAFRHCKVKRPDRVEKLASILDKLEIPYTWNIFTDKNENTNKNGLIYRRRVNNPIPYIKDSDYFVLLSDSEAMPYCVLEALAVNTKVILTPLEAYNELEIKNEENAIIIPFEYFEDGNEDKLTKVVKKIYKEKEKEINYKFDESSWEGYNNVFVK